MELRVDRMLRSRWASLQLLCKAQLRTSCTGWLWPDCRTAKSPMQATQPQQISVLRASGQCQPADSHTGSSLVSQPGQVRGGMAWPVHKPSY